MMEVALLLVSAFLVHLSLSPPNPPVDKNECYLPKGGANTLFEVFVQSIAWCSRIMMWIGTLYNLKRIVAYSLHLGGRPSEFATDSWNGRMLILGSVCIVCGATLRLWCFKSLGSLFTFEITIRPEHELVTHGPYAWVRHPSYTGVYLTLIGATIVLFGPGTWMGEYNLFGILFASLWFVKCLYAFRGMHSRHETEDMALCETFGEEWEEYASRVPYKFIPGIL